MGENKKFRGIKRVMELIWCIIGFYISGVLTYKTYLMVFEGVYSDKFTVGLSITFVALSIFVTDLDRFIKLIRKIRRK